MALRLLTPGEGTAVPLPEEEQQPQATERYALPVPTDESLDREQKRLFEAVSPGITEYSGIEFGPQGAPGMGEGEPAAPRPRKLRFLEPEPAPAIPEEEPGIWDKIVDWTSRSVIEQAAGGAREFGQRMAFESATETGEKVRRVQALEGAPEGEAAYLGPTNVSEIIRNPFKYLNPARAIVEMGLSSTEEGREVLEKRLLDEMQGKLDKAKEWGKQAEDRPFSPAVQQFLNPESPNTAWEDFMAAPATIIAELGTRSLPNMAPGMALGIAGGAAAGPAGFAAGMGAGSARIEYAATLLGELQQLEGIDIYNAQDLMKVLSNEELMNEIHQKATARATRVGAADTVAAGLAGTVLVKKFGGPILTNLTESVAQLGTQGGLGGLGEALAMTATGEAESLGEAITSREALAEIAGEAVTAPIDIAAATISGARDARAERAGWTPVPETDIDPETGKPITRPTDEVSDEVRQETQVPPQFEDAAGFSEAEQEGLKTVLDKQDAAPQQGDLFPTQEGQAAPTATQPTETQPTPPAGEPPPTAPPPTAPPPTAPTTADQPTAEPVSDIQAQLNDMVAGNRDAVFLSPEQEQAPDTLPEGVVALPNFDGKGGTLIAKDEGVAQGATAAREAGVDMQEIIGSLTRAGKGKPAEGGPVVQLRDAEGNVARESMVATMEEAQALQQEWGEGAVIVTPEETIARRDEKIAEEQTPVESPMIQRKEFENSFRDLLKRVKRKGQPGVRKALKELGTAINAVFPDATNLPSLKGGVGPPRLADYFASLDEQIIIDEVLPNLKEFLRAVVESPDAATAVQNINRLKDYVANSGAGVIEEGAKTPYLKQAAAGVTAYDVFEKERLANKQKYKAVDKGKKSPTYGQKVERERIVGPKNKLPRRALAVDELATTVSSLAERATELGINVAGEVNELIRRARTYREWASVAKPVTQKGGAGSTSVPQKFSGKNLDEVGGKLRAYAQELVEKISAAEAAKPAKKESKPASVAEPSKKASKKKEVQKPTVDVSPTKEKVVKEPQGKKVAKAVKEKTEKRKESKALNEYNALRRRAKELGVKATGKKEELAARVAEAEAATPEEKYKALEKETTELELAGKLTDEQWKKRQAELRKLKTAVEEAEVSQEEAKAEKTVKVTKKGKPAKAEKVKQAEKFVEVKIERAPLRGYAGKTFGEAMDVEGGQGVGDRALEAAGIPKEMAVAVKSVVNAANEKDRARLIQAIKDYDGDPLTFAATIYEAVGGRIDPDLLQNMLEFAQRNADKKTFESEELGIRASEEALAAEAEANGMSLEDYKTVLAETGQYSEEAQEAETPWSDPYYDMSTDEYENSQYMLSGNLPQGVIDWGRDVRRALIDPQNGLLGFLYDFTKKRGQPDPGPTNVNALLEAIIKALPSNNRYVPLARRLLQLDLNIPVYIHEDAITVRGKKALGSYYPGSQYNPSERKIRLYVGESYDPAHVFATALHEVVHAATIAAYETDSGFRYQIDGLYDKAVLTMNQQNPGWNEGDTSSQLTYGLTDAKEFISEALTSPTFQKWLSTIPSDREISNTSLPGSMSGLMRSFVNTIKKFLGYSIRNSLLEDVIIVTDTLGLQTEEEIVLAQTKLNTSYVRRKNAQTAASLMPQKKATPQTPNEVLDAQKELGNSVKSIIKRQYGAAKHMARKLDLGISNLDYIERNYRDLFDKASKAIGKVNALTAYIKAKTAATVMARKYEKKAHQLLKKLQKVDNSARSKMEIIMRAVTMANIDPTQPLNSAANAHIWTKGGKKKDGTVIEPRISKKYAERAPEARQAWINFQKQNPEAAKLLQEMAALTKEIHDTKVAASLFALGEHFDLPRPMINALQRAKDSEDIDRIINPNAVEVIEEKIKTADPKQKKVLEKILAQTEAQAEVAKSAKQILYESSIKGWYFPLRRYGDFVVSTGPDVKGDDRYVSFHTTQEEADRVAAELNKLNPENPVNVSLKIESAASMADVKSVIGDLTRRFRGKDNEATRNRLKAAMAEVLASNAAYQSQLARQNVDGVAAVDMARGFEEYVHVSKYTIGDLLVSHKVADAINDLNDLQANAEGVTEDERVMIGRVVNEIKKVNENDANDRHISRAQKVVGLLGFFNFLGSASYWALNATQTYTVTIPYLTAKYGAKAPLELAKADAIVLQAVAKALASKDKSYDGFKAQLPPVARKIVERLEAENVIQSTIAHEFGDMLSPNAMNKMRKNALGKPIARTAEMAVTVMEKVPEAVEHYNRITTAIAAYNLSKGDIVATVDAVQATQFNYDTGNRARLLKALPGGGGRALITPIMMFKTYGIGIARLLYGAMFDVVYKKGGRLEAAKLAAGLITTHTLFGGVAGGIMAAPVMAIQAAINAVFNEAGDEWDLEEASEEWAREIAGDTFATAVRRGIPAAFLGTDMSRSINLGNLMWMSDDRLDPTKVGDLKESMFNILGGPIASYSINAVSEGVRLIDEGGRNWPEFLEAAIPLKAYRSASQAVRYNMEGIESRGQLEFVSPEAFQQTLQTLFGFQPTQKTSIQDQYYSDELRKQKRSARKSQLLRWADDAIRDNDMDALGKIMDDIEAFNKSLEGRDERTYRITPADRARLRSRQRSQQREFDRKYKYSKQ
jgi:hypothetical protein